MNSKLFTGTLDLLILDLLGRGDSYGFEITQMVLNQSGGRFELKEGSLYPALHRLERQKLIKGYWKQTASVATANGENGNVGGVGGRRRKYYALTAKGRSALEAKRDEWDEFVHAVSGVLGAKARVAMKRLVHAGATACRLCGQPCRVLFGSQLRVPWASRSGLARAELHGVKSPIDRHGQRRAVAHGTHRCATGGTHVLA